MQYLERLIVKFYTSLNSLGELNLRSAVTFFTPICSAALIKVYRVLQKYASKVYDFPAPSVALGWRRYANLLVEAEIN